MTIQRKPTRILLAVSACVLVFFFAAAADTVRLKSGRIYKGKVIRYSDGEFVIRMEQTDPRSTPQERIVPVESVDTVEFDAAGVPTPGTPGTPTERIIVLDSQKEYVATGIQLRSGDKIRITASGEMQFADGRVSGPKGLNATEPWPFPERFGVLVAMVGSAASPVYHVIGESGEFVTQRDGELFLQINARSLEGARGAYTARVQLPSGYSGTPTTPTQPTPPPPISSRPVRYDLTVPANQPWTDTKIDLVEGDRLRITATGTINYTAEKTCGPDGGERGWGDILRSLPVNDANRGALVGLVGESGTAKGFLVGSNADLTIQRNGRLFLGINDSGFNENRGSFKVRVEITPARP